MQMKQMAYCMQQVRAYTMSPTAWVLGWKPFPSCSSSPLSRTSSVASSSLSFVLMLHTDARFPSLLTRIIALATGLYTIYEATNMSIHRPEPSMLHRSGARVVRRGGKCWASQLQGLGRGGHRCKSQRVWNMGGTCSICCSRRNHYPADSRSNQKQGARGATVPRTDPCVTDVMTYLRVLCSLW